MRFGVLEYTSKSKKIWKHTADRPNYLCDPDTEIDPTSFGCYVSALDGEHIPLTALIVGETKREASPFKKTLYKTIKRLTGSWPATYDWDYIKSFNVLMIVHQISDGHEITRFAKRLKKKFPHIMVLGVPTQPYGILKEYWEKNPRWLADFKAFMDTCDLFLTIVKETTPAWQQMTQKPVVYLPQPYPVEYAAQHFRDRSQKQKVLFVAGVTGRPTIMAGHRIARNLQQEFPEFAIHVTQTPDTTLDTSHLGNARYSIVPFEPWQKHLQYLSSVFMVINTDYTLTRGRVQVDCAAVGTPSVGADSDGQRDLFPDLPATATTPEADIVAQARKLILDEAWYSASTAKAQNRLQTYTYDVTAERIRALYATFQSTHA